MRQRLSGILLGVILVLMFHTIFAQVKNEEKKSRAGIGVVFHNVWQDLFLDGNIPTIFIPIDANSKLRIEPEFSYVRLKSKNDYTERISTSFRIGIGVFGKTDKNKTLIYYGLRFGYTRATYNYYSHDPYGNDSSKEKTDRFFFGPAVGGEYFYNSHFSIGCEVGFRYITFQSEENVNTYDLNERITGTKANIFLRFYF